MVKLRRGIAHSHADLRPYDNKAASGIIPQVKINYVEVGSFCGLSKEVSRNACE
jgi:hypothetical protein